MAFASPSGRQWQVRLPRSAAAVLGALVLGSAASAPPGHAQQPTPARDRPTFSADVSLVEVDVRVTDDQGRFVRTLTVGDFEIFEEGRRQAIEALHLVDVPRPAVPAAPAAPTETDIASNLDTADGRIVIVVLDDLHVDAARSTAVRGVVRQFVQRRLGPRDLVSVVQTSGRADGQQPFTSRASLLLRASDRFLGRKLASSTLARQDEYERLRDRESRADLRVEQVADPLDAERGRNAETMLDTLERLGRVLQDARGRRKTLVLVSEGVDYDVFDRSAQTPAGLSIFNSRSSSAVAERMRRAVGALTRANVTLYGIDPRGFAAGGEVLIDSSTPPQNPALALGPTSIQDEILRAQASLRALSEDTGGVAAVTTNDLASAFDRVVDDSSTYYLLAYQPKPVHDDGRFKRIKVRVKRDGLHVRARHGYVAASSRNGARPPDLEIPGQPSPQVRRLLTDPLPVGGVPLRAAAAPFKGPGRQGSVVLTLELDAREFRFRQAGGLYTDRVEAAVVAVDQRGQRLPGDRHDVMLRLKPETFASVRDRGVRLMFRLDLAPGRYQLRAAIVEENAGLVGSVDCDVDVPDFATAPLQVSGLVLTSNDAAETATPRPDPDLEQLVQTPPTTRREFSRAHTLTAAFAVYHAARARVGLADITTTVRDAGDTVRFTNRRRATQEELESAPDGYGYVVPVSLADLSAGVHVLRVEVASQADPSVVVAREVPFEIR